MKIFLDTTSDFFALILFNSDFGFVDKQITKVSKKVELLADEVEQILQKHKLNIKDIKDFYLNLGPGYFTGCRISLVYVRTISQLTKANIWTTNTFALLSFTKKKEANYYINSSGLHFFSAKAKQGQLLSQVSQVLKDNKEVNQIDYEWICNNFELITNIFKQETNILSIHPFYAKDPSGVQN
ncbi:hypothetical protein [Mesomycoplasma hyorhinis]|uniref:Gcp-like domain-containing protein n=1 Tax=Mesomycoplasma hyorhinis TaxID=2100 RepID=A0ABD6IDS9_MESHY|nr:hypothetical protein [Mesomycoplasma hyorhinis]MXR43634.1 hypothetical protein [Mesomycoplasma hyorhinis]